MGRLLEHREISRQARPAQGRQICPRIRPDGRWREAGGGLLGPRLTRGHRPRLHEAGRVEAVDRLVGCRRPAAPIALLRRGRHDHTDHARVSGAFRRCRKVWRWSRERSQGVTVVRTWKRPDPVTCRSGSAVRAPAGPWACFPATRRSHRPPRPGRSCRPRPHCRWEAAYRDDC